MQDIEMNDCDEKKDFVGYDILEEFSDEQIEELQKLFKDFHIVDEQEEKYEENELIFPIPVELKIPYDIESYYELIDQDFENQE